MTNEPTPKVTTRFQYAVDQDDQIVLRDTRSKIDIPFATNDLDAVLKITRPGPTWESFDDVAYLFASSPSSVNAYEIDEFAWNNVIS